MLNFKKYERQIILPNFGIAAQQKLQQARVLIIGAGGLGCPVILYLAASGIGNIGIAESDAVSLSNLHRQIIYSENQIGKPKAEALQQKLSDYNFKIYNSIQKENVLNIFKDYDIIVDTTDNFQTRYLVNDACVLLDKILVSASIHQYQGQLSVYNYPISNDERSATYRCLFPEAPTNSLNCAEAGVLPTIAGIIGTMQAHETIKVITSVGDILCNKLLIFDGLKMQQNIIQFSKDKVAVEELLKNGLTENYETNFDCEVENLQEITLDELNEKIKNGDDFQLIDVREWHEHETFNIGGEWIQMNDLLKQPEKIAPNKPVILYCRVGERSSITQQRLQDKYGFTNLFNLKGGIKKLMN
ncbi:MAG: hypothetical protein RL065_928 [Bacteroidota bacterium]